MTERPLDPLDAFQLSQAEKDAIRDHIEQQHAARRAFIVGMRTTEPETTTP